MNASTRSTLDISNALGTIEPNPPEPGVLNSENKLDGEGPFRVVVPQKFVGEPDQSSKSNAQNVKWPYVEDLDHNAGSCSRSATIIKMEPRK